MPFLVQSAMVRSRLSSHFAGSDVFNKGGSFMRHLLRASLTGALVAVGLLNVAMPARAALGGSPMQTPAGAAVATIAPRAFSASSAASSYTIRQTNLPSGTVVREYTGLDGEVFAVAWSGPRMPDVASLLGGYLPQVTNAVETQRTQRGGGRGAVRIDQPGLVVRSSGHMGFFAGQAYLPQAFPAAVTGSDIQ